MSGLQWAFDKPLIYLLMNTQGEILVECHGVRGLNRFQESSNWLNPPGCHHQGDWPWFSSLPRVVSSFKVSLIRSKQRRLLNKITGRFYRRELSRMPEIHFSMVDSFCICRQTWLEMSFINVILIRVSQGSTWSPCLMALYQDGFP